MILPLIYINKQEIKGEGEIVLKKCSHAFGEKSERKNQLNKSYKNKKRLFLTHYHVYKSTKQLGKITLEQVLDKFGGSVLKYNFEEMVSKQDIINIFKTILNYIQHFYGWRVNTSIEEMRAQDIFQEVTIKLSWDNKHFELLLKAGFKISFVGESYIILRHRPQDHTGVRYEEIKKELGEGGKIPFLLAQKHYSKIEKTILRRNPVYGSDLEAFQFYQKKDKNALEYYWFLLRENPKIYLDYARVITTLKEVYL